MFNEPKSIPEDLILELERNILKYIDMSGKNQELAERCLLLFGKVKTINERNQDDEYREWNKDYEESIRC